MDPTTDHQDTPAERLISLTIQGTWLLWLLGALYIAGPALGWTLAAMAAAKLYLAGALPDDRRPPPLHGLAMIWLASMLGMEIVLLAGHIDNDLGAALTIKSSIGWAKGWALLALFPFAASVLNIRPQVLYRAVCRLGLQTLVLLPFFILSPMIGLPSRLYVSPLQVVGGSGAEFFAVSLYLIDPETGGMRWQFFAPWAPAAGCVAIVHMLCALEEKRLGWKLIGLAAGAAIALMSQSRMAIIALFVIWPLARALSMLNRPRMPFAIAPLLLLGGFVAPMLIELADRAVDDFKGARAGSSRVRATLGRIAVDRWRNEAPWFGHGVVENGPHLVEYMPIGSHHTWYGLLFVKGLAGAIALAIPIIASIVVMARYAMLSDIGRVGFSMVLVLIFYSFGENLEVLGYLYWPGLILIGCAMRSASGARA